MAILLLYPRSSFFFGFFFGFFFWFFVHSRNVGPAMRFEVSTWILLLPLLLFAVASLFPLG